MALLGHWHREVSIRLDPSAILKVIRDVHPDIIWGHMLLWPPGGAEQVNALLGLCRDLRAQGVKVIIHDGDARAGVRFPNNVSDAVDLALCNHRAPREPWGIRQLYWPYFAFRQRRMAEPSAEFACDLLFAGRLGPGLYQARTELVHALKERLGLRFKVYQSGTTPSTLYRTPEVAASAGAVLGHARPETWTMGWKDVRYWQYPGAGGVLLHDDDTGPLEAGVHYVPYRSGDVDSVMQALEYAKAHGPEIRSRAFQYIQGHHTSVHRVQQALEAVGIASGRCK